jgi:hypothetical protein
MDHTIRCSQSDLHRFPVIGTFFRRHNQYTSRKTSLKIMSATMEFDAIRGAKIGSLTLLKSQPTRNNSKRHLKNGRLETNHCSLEIR